MKSLPSRVGLPPRAKDWRHSRLRVRRPWWTLRYAVNQFRRKANARLNPDSPWLSRAAVYNLESLVNPTAVGLEWGSGRCTIWLARRVLCFTSVEHDSGWYSRVNKELSRRRVRNVDLLLREDEESYLGVINDYASESLDFVLVDGGPRSACANRAVEKVRRGGVLIIDDAHRFLPSDSRSPKARGINAGPRRTTSWEKLPGFGWADFLSRISTWDVIWTSDGITDTAFYLRKNTGSTQSEALNPNS